MSHHKSRERSTTEPRFPTSSQDDTRLELSFRLDIIALLANQTNPW